MRRRLLAIRGDGLRLGNLVVGLGSWQFFLWILAGLDGPGWTLTAFFWLLVAHLVVALPISRLDWMVPQPIGLVASANRWLPPVSWLWTWVTLGSF